MTNGNDRTGAQVCLAGVLWVLAVASSSLAQTDGRQSTHGRRTLQAARIETALTVDGNLAEEQWQSASAALGFLQRDPQEGQPSTERTEFRVLYTATTLYIGVRCFDSSPRAILASDRQRDSSMGNDDNINIVLDTFHDHRNTYLFRTNPLGTQYDALVTDEGRTVNSNWDERWEVAARVDEAGWTAEFAIPFKSLRTSEENGSAWGLDLERVIRRKNESASWNNYRRGFQIESASQSGHLSGIAEIETGLRVRVKPYLLGGFSHTTNRLQSQFCREASLDQNTCNASNAGLEVMKWRITPSLTADFTANTDFAQTDVDNQQVNLDRFPLFFSERREFFQEGAGVHGQRRGGVRVRHRRGGEPRLLGDEAVSQPSDRPVAAPAAGPDCRRRAHHGKNSGRHAGIAERPDGALRTGEHPRQQLFGRPGQEGCAGPVHGRSVLSQPRPGRRRGLQPGLWRGRQSGFLPVFLGGRISGQIQRSAPAASSTAPASTAASSPQE